MLLWPFNKYPGTDYETFNWEWILKTVKEWVAKMQTFLDTISAGWDTMQQEWDDFKDHAYKDEIEEILADHPEWTTTIQNGAITFQKLNGTIQAFTTPEAFGAIGDGVTDDTQAWQDAVDVGIPVIALSEKYKCGQIDVRKNISIDFNNAEFICTENVLFDCRGEVVASLPGENDYTANTGYNITNSTYANYTGYAMLKGTNNFEKARAEYYGGFVCEFHNGSMCNRYPIDVDGVTVEIINPITVHFKNLAGVKHTTPSTSTNSIKVYYGNNCTFENFKIPESNGYVLLGFWSSMNCQVKNFNVRHTQGDNNTNSYIVFFIDSSYCAVDNCYLYNEFWHAVTTGGNYLCYENTISNSVCMSDTNYSILDHDNARNTKILNTVSTGSVGVSGGGIIENVDVYPNSTHACLMQLRPTSDPNSIYHVSKCTLHPDQTGANLNGIFISLAFQTTGNTYYVKKIVIEDVNVIGAYTAAIRARSGSSNNLEIDTVSVKRTNINTFAIGANATTLVTEMKNVILDECQDIHYGGTAETTKSLILCNSTLTSLQGTINELRLKKVDYASTLLTSTGLTIVDKLMGDDLSFRINNDVLLQPDELYIASMWYAAPHHRYVNITSDGAGRVLAQRAWNNEYSTQTIT